MSSKISKALPALAVYFAFFCLLYSINLDKEENFGSWAMTYCNTPRFKKWGPCVEWRVKQKLAAQKLAAVEAAKKAAANALRRKGR